jgi:hypothetical protein
VAQSRRALVRRAHYRQLLRSAHRSVTELENDIREWINEWNKVPRPVHMDQDRGEILKTLAAHAIGLPTQDTSV